MIFIAALFGSSKPIFEFLFCKLGVVPGNGRDLGQPAIPGLGTMPETTRVWAKIGVGNEWLVLDRPKSAMRSENLTQIL